MYMYIYIYSTFAREVEHNTRHFRKYFPPHASLPPLPIAAHGRGLALGGGGGGGGRRQIRVGYLSHDFGDHPTGHLFNSVPKVHAHGGAVEAVYFSLKV
jgi:hypothetical protein